MQPPCPLHPAPNMLLAWGELEHDAVTPREGCQSWTWEHFCRADRSMRKEFPEVRGEVDAQ